jgi:hypothetical protein
MVADDELGGLREEEKGGCEVKGRTEHGIEREGKGGDVLHYVLINY